MRKMVLIVLALLAFAARADFRPEPFGIVRTLPVPYPAHWLLVYDAAYDHPAEGRVMVIDADAGTQAAQFRGFINHGNTGAFEVSARRRELIVAESQFARGQRGDRTDLLTVWDQATLAPKGEVVLPGRKRYNGLPMRAALQLIDEDRLALVFNLTPAQSVYVVDVEKLAYLNEVSTPGCSLIYPTGRRGFTAVCADGALLSVQLDGNGRAIAEHRSAPAWDMDADPLFEKVARVGNIAYFPSFEGMLLPLDLGGDVAKPLPAWSLLSAAERAQGWRPAGMDIAASDAAGRIYLLFRKDGTPGHQQRPGTEVWVFDPATQQRVQRVKLREHTIAIGLTRDAQPLLSAIAESGEVDVYDARGGKFVRRLHYFGQETPMAVYTVN